MNQFLQIIADSAIDLTSLPHPDTNEARIRIILSLVFTITGALALLIITIAGFRYVVSHGDPNLIAQSKNAIMYSLIGLLVSIFAITIINFVIGKV
jgi:hypothetical protein